jgi:hypothetical protein
LDLFNRTSGHNFFTASESIILSVTQIAAIRTFAIADDDFADGWQWVFDVTVPTGEASLSMKFSDFVSGAISIPAASTIQFYSAQSDHTSASPVTITEANTYAGPITLTGTDLSPSTAGQQIQITVEVKVPSSSVGGSYSASYGIKSGPSSI